MSIKGGKNDRLLSLQNAKLLGGSSRGDWRYNCARCGRFSLTGSAVASLEGYFREVPLRAVIMSHTLRRAQGEEASPRAISTDELPSYWSSGRLPTPQEQADSLIMWIGENQHTPAIPVRFSELALDAWIGARLSKMPGNAPGLRWIVEELHGSRLFNHEYKKGNVWFSERSKKIILSASKDFCLAANPISSHPELSA